MNPMNRHYKELLNASIKIAEQLQKEIKEGNRLVTATEIEFREAIETSLLFLRNREIAMQVLYGVKENPELLEK